MSIDIIVFIYDKHRTSAVSEFGCEVFEIN